VQDEILTRLAKVADLKVISRTSTQHFKSTPDNLPQIAKTTWCKPTFWKAVVQKSNDQVRVNVQLIICADRRASLGRHIRSKTDRHFAVESEIAKTIAETLRARLTGSEKSSIAKRPTVNPEAYELYLKGRFSGTNAPVTISRLQLTTSNERSMLTRVTRTLTRVSPSLIF